MIPIKLRKYQINIATYAMFYLLSKNSSMKKKFEKLFKGSGIVFINIEFHYFLPFLS